MAVKEKNRKHQQKSYSSKKTVSKIKSNGNNKTTWYALGMIMLLTFVIYFKTIWFEIDDKCE